MDQIIKLLKKILIKKPLEVLAIVFTLGVSLGFFVGMVITDRACTKEVGVEQILGDDLIQNDISDESNAIQKIQPKEFSVESDQNADIQGETDVCAEISGAIINPGVYCLSQGSMIIELVKKAGGFDLPKYAGRYTSQHINLAQQVNDQMKLYVPFTSEVECKLLELDYSGVSHSSGTSSSSSGSDRSDSNSCVDINSATESELIALEGVGESTARSIIENRPYDKNEDLLDVSGIGESKYNAIKDRLCDL